MAPPHRARSILVDDNEWHLYIRMKRIVSRVRVKARRKTHLPLYEENCVTCAGQSTEEDPFTVI